MHITNRQKTMTFSGKNKARNSKLKDFSISEKDVIPSLVISKEDIDDSKLRDTVELISKGKIESCNKQFKTVESTAGDMEKKIPITIITGYLGSGKSTMLNYITNNINKSNLKIAVIMNEFGDTLDIEKSITIYNKEQSNSDGKDNFVEWLDLGNGCICCSVKDVGVKAIEDLVKRQRGNIDYIILETSGLAEPSNIAKMFWLDEGLMTNIKLDGIVTVLDGSNIENILNSENGDDIAIRQIGIADKIILNKADKIDKNKLPLIEKELIRINSCSEMIVTEYGKLDDLEKILFLNAYSNFKDFNEKTVIESNKTHSDSNIETVKLDIPVLFSLQQYTKLKQYLQKIHWQNFGYNYSSNGSCEKPVNVYGDILRSKGLIVCEGFDPFTEETVDGFTYKVLQGVRDTFDIMNTSSKMLENINRGKIVLIGRKLNKELMLKELEQQLDHHVEEETHVHSDTCNH